MGAASKSIVLGEGGATKLWTDNWTSVGALCHYALALFAASTRAGKRLSVKDGLCQNCWAHEIAGALTALVLSQFLSVWELLWNVALDPMLSDWFVWKWSPKGKYSASSAYRAFFAGSSALLGAREL